MTVAAETRITSYLLPQPPPPPSPPALLVPLPGFGARRVAPASDNSAASPWLRWQQNNGVLLVTVEAHKS
eukprot:10659799-Ditylum_brightwellii.AAC.1